ncbi:hypothetical protein [Treponema sp. R80B11-R83G3]
MRHKNRRSSPGSRRGRGSIHYRAYAEYNLIHGKPQLASTSIFTTKSALTPLPLFENSALKQSRIFPTLENAHSYIAYLHVAYKDSPATLV